MRSTSFADVILRISPAGLPLKKYSVPRDTAATGAEVLSWDFRLFEKVNFSYAQQRKKPDSRIVSTAPKNEGTNRYYRRLGC